jgi:hypothetical protein
MKLLVAQTSALAHQQQAVGIAEGLFDLVRGIQPFAQDRNVGAFLKLFIGRGAVRQFFKVVQYRHSEFRCAHDSHRCRDFDLDEFSFGGIAVDMIIFHLRNLGLDLLLKQLIEGFEFLTAVEQKRGFHRALP